MFLGSGPITRLVPLLACAGSASEPSLRYAWKELQQLCGDCQTVKHRQGCFADSDGIGLHKVCHLYSVAYIQAL